MEKLQSKRFWVIMSDLLVTIIHIIILFIVAVNII